MAKLTAAARKKIPTQSFALPGRRYPIEDRSHAMNALARVSQFGSAAEKARVRAAVHRKYPSMGRLYARADGGPVQPGQQYLVGEGGAEAFEPGGASGHGSQAGYYDWGKWTPTGGQAAPATQPTEPTPISVAIPKIPGTGPSMAPTDPNPVKLGHGATAYGGTEGPGGYGTGLWLQPWQGGGPGGLPLPGLGPYGQPIGPGPSMAPNPVDPDFPHYDPTSPYAPGLGVKGQPTTIPDTPVDPNFPQTPWPQPHGAHKPGGQASSPWDWWYTNQAMPGLTPRARGGKVAAGSRYLVGERGPEIFVPSVAGRIIPNKALGRTVGSNYKRGK